MSITARDLLRGALLDISALAAGEVPPADELSDGLRLLNRLLGSWSTENLLIFSNVREEFDLVSGKDIYTIGPSVSADFNTTRPLKIFSAKLMLTTVTPMVELPMRIISLQEYADIRIKQLQSAIPMFLYTDDNFPLTNLTVYPVPNAGCKLVLYTSKPLTSVANANTVLDLPPGYERAISTNLSIELAPSYGKTVPGELMNAAMESKANIKRQNIKPQYAKCDSALLNGSRGFNFFAGE